MSKKRRIYARFWCWLLGHQWVLVKTSEKYDEHGMLIQTTYETVCLRCGKAKREGVHQ